jgi:hypothetical protein
MKKLNRKEAYRMYRSLGFSPSEARNMRNRSNPRLLKDYRKAMETYQTERKENYQRDFSEPPKKIKKPYRPQLPADKKTKQQFLKNISKSKIPKHIVKQISEDSDYLDLDIYERRFKGLEDFFTDNDFKSWDETIDDLENIQDLGDYMDAMGEFYDEAKENEIDDTPELICELCHGEIKPDDKTTPYKKPNGKTVIVHLDCMLEKIKKEKKNGKQKNNGNKRENKTNKQENVGVIRTRKTVTRRKRPRKRK